MVDRSHLEDPLSAGLFKVCDLDDHGKDLHQVDQTDKCDKDRHLHHKRAGCHETAESQGTCISHKYLLRIYVEQ